MKRLLNAIKYYLTQPFSDKKRVNATLKELQALLARHPDRLPITIEDEVYVTSDGMKYLYHEKMFGFVTSGHPEKATGEVLNDLFGESEVFVDVGANYGLYTLQAAKRGLEVHSFEPAEEAFSYLTHNLDVNGLSGSVTANKSALGDEKGTVSVTTGLFGRNHVSSRGERVPLTTLDEYAQKNKLERIDAIKVDVEGYEEFFLRGAQQTLQKHKPKLVLEIHNRHLQRYDQNRESLLSTLRGLGYTCKLVLLKDIRYTPDNTPEELHNRACNYYFEYTGVE